MPGFICGFAVSDLGLEGLNFAIRFGVAVTLTEVIWKRQTSLLFGAIALCACAGGPPTQPDIPNSISPGWKLQSIGKSDRPAELPPDGSPSCWKADYSGRGSAEAWFCWYKETANAFDSMQRVRAEAQAVKFQTGHYFVLVKWNNVARVNLMALVRGLERQLR